MLQSGTFSPTITFPANSSFSLIQSTLDHLQPLLQAAEVSFWRADAHALIQLATSVAKGQSSFFLQSTIQRERDRQLFAPSDITFLTEEHLLAWIDLLRDREEVRSLLIVPLRNEAQTWLGALVAMNVARPWDEEMRQVVLLASQNIRTSLHYAEFRHEAEHKTQTMEQLLALDRDGMIVTDPTLTIVHANQMAGTLLSANKTLVGQPLLEFLRRPSTKQRVVIEGEDDLLAELAETDRSASQREWYRKIMVGQSVRWLHFVARPYGSDGSAPAGLVLSLHDVTALRQQEEQLNGQLAEIADQNRQWQAIFNGVQESIVLLDTKGKVMSVNPATERITKRKSTEVIGKHIGELFPKVGVNGSGVDFKGKSGLFQTLEEARPSDLLEAVIETKDERHIWVNYTYTPLWDNAGNMIALVRVTSDVTSVKAVEQMKNDFVSIASHELRTPLGVMLGYLNLFLGGQLGDLSSSQITFMERLLHATNDMAILVEDLLNISRIEAGRLEILAERFSLSELIQHIFAELEPRYKAKNIKIRFSKGSEPTMLEADRQKIGQALTNVIDNAIKYTYDNGTITIAIKHKNNAVEVSIKDSGVGIKPENISHVFEKFYRENNPLSIREGGTGLGLYITRKLIELHGGTISIKSKEGVGTTFTITLPLNAVKAYASEERL